MQFCILFFIVFGYWYFNHFFVLLLYFLSSFFILSFILQSFLFFIVFGYLYFNSLSLVIYIQSILHLHPELVIYWHAVNVVSSFQKKLDGVVFVAVAGFEYSHPPGGELVSLCLEYYSQDLATYYPWWLLKVKKSLKKPKNVWTLLPIQHKLYISKQIVLDFSFLFGQNNSRSLNSGGLS